MSDLQQIFLKFCDYIKAGSKTANEETMRHIFKDSKIYSMNLSPAEMVKKFKTQLLPIGSNKQ